MQKKQPPVSAKTEHTVVRAPKSPVQVVSTVEVAHGIVDSRAAAVQAGSAEVVAEDVVSFQAGADMYVDGPEVVEEEKAGAQDAQDRGAETDHPQDNIEQASDGHAAHYWRGRLVYQKLELRLILQLSRLAIVVLHWRRRMPGGRGESSVP